MEGIGSRVSGISERELTAMLARVAEALDAARDQLRRIEVRLALAPLTASAPQPDPAPPSARSLPIARTP